MLQYICRMALTVVSLPEGRRVSPSPVIIKADMYRSKSIQKTKVFFLELMCLLTFCDDTSQGHLACHELYVALAKTPQKSLKWFEVSRRDNFPSVAYPIII